MRADWLTGGQAYEERTMQSLRGAAGSEAIWPSPATIRSWRRRDCFERFALSQ